MVVVDEVVVVLDVDVVLDELVVVEDPPEVDVVEPTDPAEPPVVEPLVPVPLVPLVPPAAGPGRPCCGRDDLDCGEVPLVDGGRCVAQGRTLAGGGRRRGVLGPVGVTGGVGVLVEQRLTRGEGPGDGVGPVESDGTDEPPEEVGVRLIVGAPTGADAVADVPTPEAFL